MTLSQDALNEFRDSWLASEGDDFASRIQRRSLTAIADQDDRLKTLLFTLTNKAQSELDLHLEGELEVEHETNAESFAAFISGIAEATKEVAKHLTGAMRRSSDLRVLAASVGSVRLVLRAAPPQEKKTKLEQMTRTPSYDSEALDAIAVLLARAQSDSATAEHDNVLSGLAANLPHRAHRGLKRAAQAIEKQGWDIKGELRTAHGFQRINVNSFGAKSLRRVLEEQQEDQATVVMTGTIDGQRRSIGALWFTPEGRKPFEAAVPRLELMERVVQHDAANERVRATFDVVSTIGKGVNARTHQAYTLRSIEPLPDNPTLL
jgi:hypothetical protein